MSPETIVLTLFALVIFPMVISQLASEVSLIPEWDTFYTENSNNPKGTTFSNIGVSKKILILLIELHGNYVRLINLRKKVTFAKLYFPWEKTALCIYLYGNWFFSLFREFIHADIFTVECRVVPSSGFITNIISCKLISYLIINLVDYTKSSFLFSDYNNNGQS